MAMDGGTDTPFEPTRDEKVPPGRKNKSLVCGNA